MQLGAKEMSQWSRALAALSEDPGSIFSAYRGSSPSVTPVSGAMTPSSGFHRQQAHTKCISTHTHTGQTPKHKIKINKS